MPNKDLAYYEALAYRVELYRDREDTVWIAEFPELLGVKAHGESQEEALAAAREVASAWFEMALENGRSIPEPERQPQYSGKFNVRLSPRLHERAVSAGRREGLSLNAFVAQAINEKVEREETARRLVEIVQQAVAQHLPQTGALAWYTTMAGTNRHPHIEQKPEEEGGAVIGPPDAAK